MTKDKCPLCGAERDLPWWSYKCGRSVARPAMTPRDTLLCVERQRDALAAEVERLTADPDTWMAHENDFAFLWRIFAVEDDDKLDSKALELKRMLLRVVSIEKEEVRR